MEAICPAAWALGTRPEVRVEDVLQLVPFEGMLKEADLGSVLTYVGQIELRWDVAASRLVGSVQPGEVLVTDNSQAMLLEFGENDALVHRRRIAHFELKILLRLLALFQRLHVLLILQQDI